MMMDLYRGGTSSVKITPVWYEQSTTNNTTTTVADNNSLDMQMMEEARKLCIQDIDLACKKLNISADPYSWSVYDVRNWLQWLQVSNNLTPFRLDYFQLDGEHLCRLSELDFRQRCPSAEVGQFLFGKLDLWKWGFSYLSQTLVDSIFADTPSEAYPAQYEGNKFEAQLNGQAYPVSSSATSSSYVGGPARPTELCYQAQHYGSPSIQSAFSPSSATSNYSSCMSPVPSPSDSISSSSSCYGASPIHMGASITPSSVGTTIGAFSGGNPTALPMLNANSHTSDYGSDGIISEDEEIEDDKWMLKAMLNQQQQQQTHTQCTHQQHVAVYGEQATSVYTPTAMAHPYHRAAASSPNAPNYPNGPRMAPAPIVKPTIKTGGSGSSIHLWQFLKELLQNQQAYGGFIRWLDREKGVFKIEDSVRVAKLWGARKNRPAMNYDKLSRSIRQYYKKGIMKKTERSQRLVYQFCAPYVF